MQPCTRNFVVPQSITLRLHNRHKKEHYCGIYLFINTKYGLAINKKPVQTLWRHCYCSVLNMSGKYSVHCYCTGFASNCDRHRLTQFKRIEILIWQSTVVSMLTGCKLRRSFEVDEGEVAKLVDVPHNQL